MSKSKKKINKKALNQSINQDDDSLKDSASAQFHYDAFVTDTIAEEILDIDRYLGEYNQSATKNFISSTQLSLILSIVILFAAFCMLKPDLAITAFLICGSTLHLSLTIIKSLVFNLKEKVRSLRQSYIEAIKSVKEEIQYNSDEFPIYSILLPVLTEDKQVLEQLFEAIYNLNYPKDKLQILLLVEEIDSKTINYVKQIESNLNYQLIIIPDFQPRTKAKACNYALNFVKGEYVVIFDADDIPSPDQLMIAIERFKIQKDNGKLACLQAKLNYYNADENLLTRLFSLEYAVLFDKILPSLSRGCYPLPLGGTSNHLRADVLKQLKGWDIYNLAEDAEIGIRLAINGYKTETIDSHTAEESPVTIWAWIKQRSRWLKGFIQTYLLYLQRCNNLTDKIGAKKSFISMHFMIGLSTLSLIVTPFMIAFGGLLISGYTSIDNETNDFILGFSGVSAGLWIMSTIYQSVKTIKSSNFLKAFSPIKKIILILAFPPYFILHTVAALYAVFDLIRRPFYWSKTKHGITKSKVSIKKLFNKNS